MERENIRVQTMAGREQKAREGKWNGGFAPYGYKLENGELAHILSGILKCPCCGKGMYRNIAKAGRKNNKSRYYYYCKNTVNATGHKCTFRRNIEQSQIDDMLAKLITAMTKEGEFKDAIQDKIGATVDTTDLEKQLSVLNASLHQAETIKTRLEQQMDNLDVTDTHYDKKISDLQRRLDAQYDRIDEVEETMTELKSQIYELKKNQIDAKLSKCKAIKERDEINMKSLVYVDACVRGEESRTRRIAEPLIRKLSNRYEITRYELNKLPITIVKEDLIRQRVNGNYDPMALSWAETIRDADRIVIAAPFWDMSYPAVLKNFLELCSVFSVTFTSDDKICHGNCKAEKLLYITTRGMNITTGDPLEQATPYLKALSWLWGIGPMDVIAAQNMDYISLEQVEKEVERAIREGLELVEEW